MNMWHQDVNDEFEKSEDFTNTQPTLEEMITACHASDRVVIQIGDQRNVVVTVDDTQVYNTKDLSEAVRFAYDLIKD